MSAKKLKNAPLKEVICEIFWDGETQLDGSLADPEFDNAIGRFKERLKTIAPVQKRKVPVNLPVKFFAVPTLQYWTGELKWPVIQHGPGILTINDIEANYQWISDDGKGGYRNLIHTAVKLLTACYDSPLKFNQVRLKYLDVVDVPDGNVYNFIRDNLQTEINFNYPILGERAGFNLLQEFQLEHNSILQLQINTGLNNTTNQQAAIWNISVGKKDKMDAGEILEWLDFAHTHTSAFFKNMLNTDYYASLDK